MEIIGASNFSGNKLNLKTQPSWQQVTIHCALPLLVGLLIYIFLRSGTIINQIFDPLVFKRDNLYDNFVTQFIRFNLPDFLWAYSLTAALVFWKQQKEEAGILFFFVVLIFLAATEFVQLSFPERFTFNWLDLFAAISGSSLSYLINKKCYEKKNA